MGISRGWWGYSPTPASCPLGVAPRARGMVPRVLGLAPRARTVAQPLGEIVPDSTQALGINPDVPCSDTRLPPRATLGALCVATLLM